LRADRDAAPIASRPSLALAAILLLALAVRLAVAWTQVYVAYLDETFQYFEQAHRLAFGSGIKPWEFFDGARSWLLPGLISSAPIPCSTCV
jgi:hypothetical protein